ncbi:MAG: hypothetical protein A2Y34_01680 [Spirochaetes bacterium GWC1_27_15]|nr:MAG: hypothetical protein A2Z98_17460 [Spirochaetes bacterium GWB1_27_13]OHD26644.1 MAG: hypothetical protein A2Y34_01680 [Spirochaetes bacterium GWC1_27_15]
MKNKNLLNDVKNTILDLSCVICGNKDFSKEIDFICSDCFKSFEKLNTDNNICKICGHTLDSGNYCPSCSLLKNIYYDSYKFIQYYTGFFKNIIRMWKKEDNFMINKLFFHLLINKNLLSKEIPITVVPDTKFKTIKRGRAGLHYLLFLLKKNGFYTLENIYKKKFILFSSQKNKSQENRFSDIQNLYFLPKKNVNKFKGEIILIDDIYTTGSTLNYGSKLLKEAGFSKVHTITFFRTIFDKK